MNTMNMRGFSAEASLYRSSGNHQIGAMGIGLKQKGEVVLSSLRDPTEVEGSWFEWGCHEDDGYCWT